MLNRHSNKVSHCGVTSNACLQGKTKYLVMYLSVQLSNLLIQPLSKHQDVIFFPSSVQSIIKKRKIRQGRIDKPFEITYNYRF